MPDGLNLHLDFLDASTFDSFRGPGSSSSEQIPTISPDFHSHFPSSLGSHQSRRSEHTEPAAAFDALNEDNADSELDAEVTKEDGSLHVVVVGGNVGAYATSLALAKSERIHVTLVNVGVGPFVPLGSEPTAQAIMLSARDIALLDELGRWEGSEHREIQEDVPFDMGGGSNRWKGKGVNGQSSSLAERIQQGGIHLLAFALRRYDSGELLTFQEYSMSTGEDVSMTAIDTDAFLAILRDTCLSHPRIDVRPRAIVRTVLPGSPPPAITGDNGDSTISLNSKAHDVFGLGDSTPRNSIETKCTGIGRRPEAAICDRDRRRKARESFIQLEDDDQESPIQVFSGLSPVAPTPISGVGASLDEDLRNPPSHMRGRDPFSTEEVLGDAVLEASKLDTMFNAERYKPVIVLTSGERVEADAVIGTEGPLSKVLETIQSEHGESAYQSQMIREDGVYRAIVPTSRLAHEPELCSLFVRNQSSGIAVTWPGPGQILTAHLINRHSLHVSLIIKGGRAREDVIADEDEMTLALQMKRKVLAWCPTVRKVLSFVESATYEPVFDYNQLEQWVSRSGRVAALGDAAHPPLSFAHQALSATISDAVTLGLIFSKYPHPIYLGGLHPSRLVPHLLKVFASIRRPLCLRAQLTAREARDLLWLEDGEFQRRRDRTFREFGVYDEDEKRREWLEDPLQAVERWWKGEIRRFQADKEVEEL